MGIRNTDTFVTSFLSGARLHVIETVYRVLQNTEILPRAKPNHGRKFVVYVIEPSERNSVQTNPTNNGPFKILRSNFITLTGGYNEERTIESASL